MTRRRRRTKQGTANRVYRNTFRALVLAPGQVVGRIIHPMTGKLRSIDIAGRPKGHGRARSRRGHRTWSGALERYYR